MENEYIGALTEFQKIYPEKFVGLPKIFRNIHPGDTIFIGTGCGEPQYLVGALTDYVQEHPKAFFDTEILQVWSLGVAPYTESKFKENFRHNSFFIGENIRQAINQGSADYTPVFLSEVPGLIRRKLAPVDVALIQTAPPDRYGFMSLGVSVDIIKAAVETASVVIAQVNANMPRVHGDTFINIKDVDFIVPYDESLLEYKNDLSDEIACRIGKFVARIVEDGDTIQVGYGSVPNAILKCLSGKRQLGVHTELLTDGIVALMKAGVVDNSRKNIDPDKTVAAFCMGSQSTYEFIHDNPAIKFAPVDYTNNPLIIAQQTHMTAINSVLGIDLTGQATAESIGKIFYSGIGGQADFMRGTILAPGGKTVLVLQSTANNGTISRIVPFLYEGSGVTVNRGDVHYVVTEYGIAYLHGKSIRERAMALIAIAHPKFRPWLIKQAKKLNLIYKDQAYVPGKRGQYPDHLERTRTTKSGLSLLLRPVKLDDEPLLKKFFYAVSEESMYRRFMAWRRSMPHERLQEFIGVDYRKDMIILAVLQDDEREVIIGMGQYGVADVLHTAELAFVVRDDYQNKGVGSELVSYLTYLAQKQGISNFYAEVLLDNLPMLHLFEKMGFDIERTSVEGVYELKMSFR